MPIAAIYARVSSDKQREEGTIASQTAALIGFARSHGYQVPTEWVFEDEGYSGASLVRPGLERCSGWRLCGLGRSAMAVEGCLAAWLSSQVDG